MRPTIGIAAAAAAAAAALAVAMPARAQGYVYIPVAPVMNIIGSSANQPERECMAGKLPRLADLAAARAEATGSLQRYLHLAAGPAPADATAAFSYDARRREWLRNGNAGSPRAVDDPLARALAARAFALPEPDYFHRSGDGFGALGIWRIAADGDAGPGGYYRALFRLEGLTWNLQRLEVVEGAEPPRAGQFCHAPGDLGDPARAEARRASLAEAQTMARASTRAVLPQSTRARDRR